MRPHGYHHQHQAAAAFTHAQQSQAHAAAHYGYPRSSIEASTSPAAFSSPRGMYNDIASDNSSDSSGSRESSAYPHGSIPSPATTKGRSAKTTRTKRGSESQGSGSDRSTKRPDSSKAELWCEDCECDIAECPEPKVHKARVKKIVKEKSSRSSQAAILQSHEDITQCSLNIGGCYKVQQPGNKKKSGMLYDKKEVMTATLIQLEEANETIASFGQEHYDGYKARASFRVQNHIAQGSPMGLPAGSLMSGPNGEGPCLHELNHRKCETPIECRKNRRDLHYKTNIDRIMSTASHHSSMATRSSSSTPRRH
jgi:hypothetical protein